MKDNRYMKCETITGEWWYKDLQTGEDLPKYATPIIGLEEEPEILARWQDPVIEEYKKEIDRLNPYKIGRTVKRKVAQMDLEGNILATYNSLAEAERKTGIYNTNIAHVCGGKRKTAGGYKWKYIDLKEREAYGVKFVVSGETFDEYKGTLQEQLEEKDKEIERLQNIINKLEDFIKAHIFSLSKEGAEEFLKELKEGNKDDL